MVPWFIARWIHQFDRLFIVFWDVHIRVRTIITWVMTHLISGVRTRLTSSHFVTSSTTSRSIVSRTRCTRVQTPEINHIGYVVVSNAHVRQNNSPYASTALALHVSLMIDERTLWIRAEPLPNVHLKLLLWLLLLSIFIENHLVYVKIGWILGRIRRILMYLRSGVLLVGICVPDATWRNKVLDSPPDFDEVTVPAAKL